MCRKRGSASSVDTAPAEWNPRNNARKLLAAVRGRCPGERLQGVVGAIYFVCFARFLADPQRPWDPPPFPVLTCVCARIRPLPVSRGSYCVRLATLDAERNRKTGRQTGDPDEEASRGSRKLGNLRERCLQQA